MKTFPNIQHARANNINYEPQKILGKVLFGSSDPRLQDRLYRFLSRWAHTVECSASGRDCFDIAMHALQEGEPYDLILVDTDLPVLDAYSVTTLLRDNDYPATIISFSGEYFPMHDIQSEAAGCNGHILKDNIEQRLPGFFAYQHTMAHAVNS